MADIEKIPLHASSQSDIDEIENLFQISVQPAAPVDSSSRRPPSPPRATIPVTPVASAAKSKGAPPPPPPPPPPPSYPAANLNASSSSETSPAMMTGFGGGPGYDTLTEPVWETLKRDINQVFENLKNVVFPNPYRKDAGKALKDWDLWGPFFFIIFLATVLSYSASADRAKVFATVFAVLSAGAVVLTVNVVLLGGSIIFFQSLSVLGYCLFPLAVGAAICMVRDNKLFRSVVVLVTVAWSSWAVYPFMSSAVPGSRKALAIYPVFLLYVSLGFLVLANN
ncbi:hypothetical protein SELMODRAFT_148966 [Selaginella moellendorffii]|uniref:Protein YIP n=1 Tax=Selaginella moellendorffii TaxID=88036 RepID=D8RQ41_SELML|nr:protein YIPF6 homolog [Selaginella moellendorffii]EFJ25589.1 hypothetical protein SELMODRAFT_148966 [Selaginella moellendorffii]|eukprot:XP_002973215.1 protein YIPF6 homolog [Selaginella moellendorffii]